MEKELKSCTGVLLRAVLKGHGQFSQSANFCQKGWDGRTYFETYFALLYFWTFAQCGITDLEMFTHTFLLPS